MQADLKSGSNRLTMLAELLADAPPPLACRSAGRSGYWGFRAGDDRRQCDDKGMLVAFSVTPLGVGDSVGDLVAEAVRVVRASGLPNRTDAMFTTVEGEWDEVLAVIKQAVDAVAAHAPRVTVSLKADIRPGVTDALTAKVEHIERKLADG